LFPKKKISIAIYSLLVFILVSSSTLNEAIAGTPSMVFVFPGTQTAYKSSDAGTLRVTNATLNANPTGIDTNPANVISSTGDPTVGITITLTETGFNTGVFEADFFMTTAGSSSGSTLRVNNGDTITGTYAAGPLVATAIIDDIDPILVGVITPTPDGANGWNLAGPIDIVWTCTDPGGSGPDLSTVPDTPEVTTENGPSGTLVTGQTCDDLAGNTSPPAADITLKLDLNNPTGTIVINGPAQPVPDGTTVPTVSLSLDCNDGTSGSGCTSVELDSDLRGSLPIIESKSDGLSSSSQTLTAERGNKEVTAVFKDVSGRTSALAPDSTELVPVVTVTGTDSDSPIWDVDTTITSGTVENSIQGSTDGVIVNFNDETPEVLISKAICLVDDSCTWTCSTADTCAWNINHVWASPSKGGSANTINARVVDNDSDTPPPNNVADFLLGGIVDDDAPDLVTISPQQITWTRDSIADLGRNADSLATTFTWGSALRVGYTAESVDAPATSPTGTAVTLDGQTVLYSGTILETDFTSPTSDILISAAGEERTKASVVTDLKVQGPDGIGTADLNVVINSVDYVNADLRSDLGNMIHETRNNFNPIIGPVAGQFFGVSGFVEDLDFFDDRYAASLSNLFVTYDDNGGTGGTGVFPDNLSTSDMQGVTFEDATNIADFVTIDPVSSTVLRTDRGVFLPPTAKITLPPGVEKVQLSTQNIIFNDQEVTLRATTDTGTLEIEVTGTEVPGTTPATFAIAEFDANGGTISQIEVISVSGVSEIVVSSINLINTANNPPLLFTQTYDGLQVSTSPTVPGFTLGDGAIITPGLYYDSAISSTTPSSTLEVRSFFQTISGGSPVGTAEFGGSQGVTRSYSTEPAALGFGVSVNIDQDSGTGYSSLGCQNDSDGDGACEGWEGATDSITYSVGTTSSGTAVTSTLALPFGQDYCSSGFPTLSQPTPIKKDIWVEIDWSGAAHSPLLVGPSGGATQFNGPANLCDLQTAFANSNALNNAGDEAGIVLRLLPGEDVTPGGHLDALNVWTDRDQDRANDFNSIKLRNIGIASLELRPVLTDSGISISYTSPPVAGPENAIMISGITIAPPSGTFRQTKGDINVQVKVTLNTPTLDLSRGATAAYANTWTNPDIYPASSFVVLASGIQANIRSDDNKTPGTTGDDFEVIDVKIPFEIRAAGTYNVRTIIIPFDMGGSAVVVGSPTLGFNTPNVISTRMNTYYQFTHYAFVDHSIGTCGPSGAGEENGNDFIVSLGCNFGLNEEEFTTFSGDSTPATDANNNQRSIGLPREWKGTFMHELGHNLGFKHGGAPVLSTVLNTAANGSPDAYVPGEPISADNRKWFKPTAAFTNPDATINCKPNYNSVMKYSGQGIIANTPLTYSRGNIESINEVGLSEALGLHVNTDFYSDLPQIVYGTPTLSFGNSHSGIPPSHTHVPINWNGDSDATPNDVGTFNVNNFQNVNGCDGSGVLYGDREDIWNANLNFKGATGTTGDGDDTRDNNDANGNQNSIVRSMSEWYDGLLYFNTLNPDGTNIGPSGSRMDLSFQLLSCDPNDNPLITDVCIDTGGIVKKELFYSNPSNTIETPPAECTGDNGTPSDPTDDGFNRPACKALEFVPIELVPINGANIRLFAQRCTDAICTQVTGDRIEFTDPGPSGPGFHQHDTDGVYHFSVNTDQFVPIGGPAGTYALTFDKQTVPKGFLLDFNEGGTFLEFADTDEVTVIITIPEPLP